MASVSTTRATSSPSTIVQKSSAAANEVHGMYLAELARLSPGSKSPHPIDKAGCIEHRVAQGIEPTLDKLNGRIAGLDDRCRQMHQAIMSFGHASGQLIHDNRAAASAFQAAESRTAQLLAAERKTNEERLSIIHNLERTSSRLAQAIVARNADGTCSSELMFLVRESEKIRVENHDIRILLKQAESANSQILNALNQEKAHTKSMADALRWWEINYGRWTTSSDAMRDHDQNGRAVPESLERWSVDGAVRVDEARAGRAAGAGKRKVEDETEEGLLPMVKKVKEIDARISMH